MSDEEIFGKEMSQEEYFLREENNKLKKRLIETEESNEVMSMIINKINDIVKEQIKLNIRKTRTAAPVSLVKKYREELLVLRELEKQLQIYFDFKDN